MTETKQSICVNCQAPIEHQFCSHCGEQRFEQESLTYNKLFKQLVTSLTDIDGKVIRSFRLLLFKPGQLVGDYTQGIRKNRLNPFQIFVLANIVYFLSLSFIGQNTFNTPLEIHLNATNFFHQELAVEWVNQYLASSGLTMDQYRTAFDQKIELQSKTLILLIIPIYALLIATLFVKQKFIGIKALVLSSHFFAFVLIFQLLLSFVATSLTLLFQALFKFELQSIINDEWVSSLLLLTGLMTYLYLSIRRVFVGSWWSHLIKIIGLSVGLYFSILLYRSILFFTTYFSVST